MPTILDEIVLRKKREVAEALAQRSLRDVQHAAEQADAPRPFFTALTAHPSADTTSVIAEIKRKSPSAGIIRDDFDPLTIARQYHAAGARAISCLTDEVDFGGDLAFIAQIRAHVDLPVLRKDFIVDPYQIWEARAAGADAILLIAECLDTETMSTCRTLAENLGMTTLVEVHSADNLRRVLGAMSFSHDGHALLGINNRDLTRMETNLAQTAELLEMTGTSELDRSLVVSESGIKTPHDLATLRAIGVGIVLVGEHLMAQPDPGEALQTLLA